MAAIVTHQFRYNNADQFYNEWALANHSFYLYVGRPQPFSAGTGGGTDSAPPTPLDNTDDAYMYWRDMLAIKRVTAADRQYAIPRHDWTTGTIYDYYRGDYGATVNSATVETVAGGIDMFSTTTKMYVKTTDNNVYKCMGNNSGGTSTVMPTGTSNNEFQTSPDLYWWKYMYTLSTTQITDFLTTDFMGVATNSTVSAAAVDGAVTQYKIENGGTGFTTATDVAATLRGDGSGATFNISTSGGAITSVTSTAAGTNYTFADCNIAGISGIGSGTGAVVTPIIGPKGGHGSNAITELGGFYVMTNTTIAGTAGSGDFVVDQDFRRVGMVLNPYNYGTTTVATADTLSALKSVTFAASPTPGTFTADEIITGATSGAKGVVVDWEPTTRVLKYIQTQWTGVSVTAGVTQGNLVAFAASEVITGADSGATGTVSAVTAQEVAYYSGTQLYVENRKPITRAADQTENIKLIIEF